MLGLKQILGNCWPDSLTPSNNLRFWFIKAVKTYSIYTRKWISKIQNTHCHLTRDAKLLLCSIYYYVLFLLIMATHSKSFMKWNWICLTIQWILIILCKCCCTVPFPMGWRQTLLISQGVIKIIRLRSLNALYPCLLQCTLTLLPGSQLIHGPLGKNFPLHKLS